MALSTLFLCVSALALCQTTSAAQLTLVRHVCVVLLSLEAPNLTAGMRP